MFLRGGKYKQCNRGFTLVEVLLSIALVSLLAGVSALVYQSFQVRNDLDIAANTLVQTLRRGQILAQGVNEDSPWGVYVAQGKIVLFQGESYERRNARWDEEFALPRSIIPAENKEIIFAKLSGEPAKTDSIILNSSINEIKIIEINSKGIVNY